jgi:hypothetical protein
MALTIVEANVASKKVIVAIPAPWPLTAKS